MKFMNNKMRGIHMAALSAVAVLATVAGVALFGGSTASALTSAGANVKISGPTRVSYGHGPGNDGATSGHFTRKYTVQSGDAVYVGFCGNPNMNDSEGTHQAMPVEHDVIKYLIYANTANTKEANRTMTALYGWAGDADQRYAFVHATVSKLHSGNTKGLNAAEIAKIDNVVKQVEDRIAQNDAIWQEAKGYQLYAIVGGGERDRKPSYQNIFWIEKKDSSIKMEKLVRIKGATDGWRESVEAKVGDEVEFKVFYKNSSANIIDNVTMQDTLPKNIQMVSGSTRFTNGNKQDEKLGDELVSGGIKIGGYYSQAEAYAVFTGKIVDESLACGKNELVNWATVKANGEEAKDDAKVIVEKVCEEPKKEEPKECSKNDGKFYGKDGKEVDEKAYKDQCEPKPKECSKNDGKFYGKDGKEVDEKAYKDQCEPKPKECSKNDGKFYGKDGKEVNEADYKDQCEPKPKACSKDTKSGKYYDKDSKEVDEKTYKDQCEPKLEEPKELPNTGAGAIVSGIIGAGAVTTALGYYVSSRKKLVK